MTYEYIRAEDYCDSVRDGTHDTPKPAENGYKLVTGKHIRDGRIDSTEAYYISEKDYIKINERSKVDQWDVLMSMIGNGLGRSAVVDDLPNYAIKNIALFKVGDEIKAKWLHYYLSGEEGQGRIYNSLQGSGQPFISLSYIRDFPVPNPPREIMKRVVGVLEQYDFLIDNNQKQIKLLEEAAQRLYKEWFVDLRFPGYENVKVVDGVPEGWEKKQICNIADIKAGGDKPETVNKDKSEKTPIPIYANGIEKDGLYGYTTKPVIEKESVTISARGTVGFVFLRRTPYVPIVRLLSVIPDSIPAIYLYYCLKNETFERNGTSQQQITVPMVKNKNLLIADILLIDKFTSIVTVFHDKIDILKTQIELLTEARDRLLPKMMSGELEV